MGTPKPRILPWLVAMLDGGQLEGVAWLDERRTRFRIPWKHGLRQDAQVKDFGIFQAWAEASGAYIPGRDKPDLPTWKRNFRSALNRKEVLRLAEDQSKDPHDPHKVYEFVDPEARDSSQLDTSPETEEGSTSDAQEDILELLSDMALVPLPDDMAQGQYPQLLSPNLDNPILCPNPTPSENPLKLLLVPEEREELLPDCEHGHKGEVPKDVDSDVFDLRPFVTDLIAFMEGSGHSPRYTLWFCLGELWPQSQPWVKKLVMVKVVPTCLKALLNMARSGGASSLENTVDLHISNSQPLSLTSEQYKAYLQDLVEDMDF
ncbi:interferon regulatory factor 3 isoform X3 [Octodon degus]|uniref:Interferon regulatory factor 3 isoform X3 n=1 Tax=Octodon degus TaxID=10160 RepID=A0A6P6DS34_OCTDE|nr:interferon regulatory factor 3 isoform X3 [Octodon degus]